ncbi:hypothetical protein ALON55S_03603 [Alishewanella longhuensis]
MLEGAVEGYVRVSDISRERIEDATTVLKVGEEVEARLMGVDCKNRVISLSIKAKFEAEEKEAMDTITASSQKLTLVLTPWQKHLKLLRTGINCK